MTTEKDDYAFPLQLNDPFGKSEQGLTKREYFAAMALQGMLASSPEGVADWRLFTEQCVKAADSLIDSLNRQQ